MILQPNKQFQERVTKYKPINGLLAVGLFFIMCALYALLAVLQKKIPVMKDSSILLGCILNSILIALSVLFVKIEKESLSSIGLFNGNWKKSCLIGFVLAAILFFNNCLSSIISGASFIPVRNMFKFIIYYLTVGLCEEIVFRGYIGTRLYGLIKNHYFVILVNGILFVLMHFPYRIIMYNMTISDLTIFNIAWILNLFITHIVFSFIYLKTNSLYGAVIPHWMSNLAYNLIAR